MISSICRDKARRKAIGGRIRAARIAAGVSQTTLADELGYSSNGSISEIESGQMLPSADRLELLCFYLDVRACDILSDKA